MGGKLFIVGTGTDVGKTFVAGLILKKLRESGVSAAYYKAAMSGNRRGPDGRLIPGDAACVKSMSGLEQPLSEMCPFVYERALSPHLAARLEGHPVSLERVVQEFRRLSGRYDYVTMEGSGGVVCPVRFEEGEEIWLTDVIKACARNCLLVADAGLGSINGVALSAAYLRAEGIPLRGIVLNRFQRGNVMHEDNLRMCEAVSGTKVVARVGEGETDLGLPTDLLLSLYA